MQPARSWDKNRVALLSCFFLILAISVGGGSIISSSATTTTYPMQSSIDYSFVWGTSVTNSHWDMSVAAFSSNTSIIPSHVAVSYWVTYNGTVYYNHGCSLNYATGQTYASCSFTVPFKGWGDYWFYATFKDNSGKIVAQSLVDPLSEPEWAHK